MFGIGMPELIIILVIILIILAPVSCRTSVPESARPSRTSRAPQRKKKRKRKRRKSRRTRRAETRQGHAPILRAESHAKQGRRDVPRPPLLFDALGASVHILFEAFSLPEINRSTFPTLARPQPTDGSRTLQIPPPHGSSWPLFFRVFRRRSNNQSS